MKKCSLMCAMAALIFVAQTAQAQITLTSANMPAAHLNFVSDQIVNEDALNLGNAGPNQSWDFSGVATYGFPETDYYLEPAQAPESAQFPTCNLAQTQELSDTADYSYLILSAASFAILGSSSNGDVATYTPALKSFQFPFTYQSTFNQNVQVNGVSGGLSITGTSSTAVVADAYGTVKTNLGTFPCLRVKRITNLTLSYLGFNIIQNDTLFEWWTTQYKAPVMTYDRNSTDFFGSIDYGSYAYVLLEQAVPTSEPASQARIPVEAAPNPTTGSVALSFELPRAGATNVTVADAMGKIVLQQNWGVLSPGVYSQPIDLSRMPAGVYVAVLRQEGKLLGVKQLVRN